MLVGTGVLAAANLKASPGISPGLPCLRWGCIGAVGAVRGCALKLGAGKADPWRGPLLALGMGQRGWDSGAPWQGMLLRKHGLPRSRGATVEGCTRAGAAHTPAPPPSAPGVVRTGATRPSVATACWSTSGGGGPVLLGLVRCAQPVSAFPPSHSGGTRYPRVASKPKLSTRAEAAKQDEWKSPHLSAKAVG